MDGPAAASPSNSTIARLRNLLRGWRERFGLDLRSLALFRILLGLLLLVDLAARLTDLRVFYSDAGVLPRVDLLGRVATSSTPWLVSLHMLSGLWGVQLLLFAVAACCAFCLLIGHRTRLFTFLSWVLLVSLHARNLTILNAGDLLFRVLLFWSLFLPLGARCSVDAAMREPSDKGPEKGKDRTWSVPAFCFMAQVTILYWVTGLLKNHPVWTGDRTAVWYALQLDYMALPLAVLMRELPAAWLELMTRTTLHVEFLVPVLIWIPFL
ncbi:MAG: HTTM domain-containing protein, partial [Gemmatimonadetes bacterium]|nr:HTTM domain-containing protein [Gemmatimonadota bacterium]